MRELLPDLEHWLESGERAALAWTESVTMARLGGTVTSVVMSVSTMVGGRPAGRGVESVCAGAHAASTTRKRGDARMGHLGWNRPGKADAGRVPKHKGGTGRGGGPDSG